MSTATARTLRVGCLHFLSRSPVAAGVSRPGVRPARRRRAPGPRTRPPREPAVQHEQCRPPASTLPQRAGGAAVGGGHHRPGDGAGAALLAHPGDDVSRLGAGGARPAGGRHCPGAAGARRVPGHRVAGSSCARWLGLLAELHGRAGQGDAGRTLLAEAMRRGTPGRAVVLCGRTRPAFRGISCCRRARGTRRGTPKRICARPWPSPGSSRPNAYELRAAMSLGRLWQQQGKRAEAWELLAPDLRLVHRGL